jgi:hypothetical protein
MKADCSSRRRGQVARQGSAKPSCVGSNPTVASRVRVIVKDRVGVSRNRGDPCASSRIPYRGHGSEGRSRVWERTRLPHVRFLAQTAARNGGNAGLACKGLQDPDVRGPRWRAPLLIAWHLLDLLMPH